MDRRTFLTTSGLAVAGAAFSPSIVFAESGDVALNALFERIFQERVATSPELATSLGLDKGPLAALKGQLSPATAAERQRDLQRTQAALAALAKVDRASLSPAAQLNLDVVRYSLETQTVAPGKFQIGNITEWAASGAAIPAGYVNMVDGGVMEGAIGKSWSVEGWAGWQVMMKQYNAIMAAVAEPKLIILNQWGDPTDYQSMRYGLGSTLLNDGYYSFTNTATSYHGVVWFDEFDAKLGQAQAIPTAAWKQGVWRRDFDNGIVLVNPKGNGNQTVTLETSYVKLQGTQDPAINNGQTVTTVTLKDRDGIILMRKNPVKRPAAPQKLTAGT